jgi:hypothetical protein
LAAVLWGAMLFFSEGSLYGDFASETSTLTGKVLASFAVLIAFFIMGGCAMWLARLGLQRMIEVKMRAGMPVKFLEPYWVRSFFLEIDEHNRLRS